MSPKFKSRLHLWYTFQAIMMAMYLANASNAVANDFQIARTRESKDLSFQVYDRQFSIIEGETNIDVPAIEQISSHDDLVFVHDYLSNQQVYTVMVKNIELIAQMAGFNSWLRALYVVSYAREYLESDEMSQNLLIFCMLKDLGHPVSFYFEKQSRGNHSAVFLATKQELSGWYVRSPDFTYYAAFEPKGSERDFEMGSFYWITQHESDVELVDLMGEIEKVTLFKERRKKRKQSELSFHANGRNYVLKYSYSQSVVEYFDTLPVVYYSPTGMAQLPYLDSQTEREIIEAIAKQVDTDDEMQLTKFLMNLTQEAFEYLTDEEYWGYERPLYAEMMLSHRVEYSDCEDRATLFIALAKAFGLNAAYIHFPGHMMAGLRGMKSPKGHLFDSYVPIEATGTGYDIGNVYSEYENQLPEQIIQL